MECHVEQYEDDEEHDRNENLQSLTGANLEFVLARPNEGVARRQFDLLRNSAFGLIHVPADVTRHGVEVDVSGELRIFIANHRRPRRQRNFGQLAERDLSTHRWLDKHSMQIREALSATFL